MTSQEVDSAAWVEVRELRKRYGEGPSAVDALRGVDLDLRRGELVALVGPSGSGKTTLLNILGCLDRPTSGTVRIQGRDVFLEHRRTLTRFRAESLGFVFQSFNLFAVLTAFENVEYPLLLAGVRAAERQRRVREMLERVGLDDKSSRHPDELSGGEKQRVAIARALVHQPVLVLADEPTANLDSETAETVVALISRLNRELGTTFVVSTHDEAILGRVQRVLAIRDGRITVPSRPEP